MCRSARSDVSARHRFPSAPRENPLISGCFRLAPAVQPDRAMLQAMSHPRQMASTLRVGVGIERGTDIPGAVLAAATTARADLDGATAHLAIVLATAAAGEEGTRAIRGVLGPVGVTG